MTIRWALRADPAKRGRSRDKRFARTASRAPPAERTTNQTEAVFKRSRCQAIWNTRAGLNASHSSGSSQRIVPNARCRWSAKLASGQVCGPSQTSVLRPPIADHFGARNLGKPGTNRTPPFAHNVLALDWTRTLAFQFSERPGRMVLGCVRRRQVLPVLHERSGLAGQRA